CKTHPADVAGGAPDVVVLGDHAPGDRDSGLSNAQSARRHRDRAQGHAGEYRPPGDLSGGAGPETRFALPPAETQRYETRASIHAYQSTGRAAGPPPVPDWSPGGSVAWRQKPKRTHPGAQRVS